MSGIVKVGTWTEIRNKSAQPISLIPYAQGDAENSDLTCNVIKRLAHTIGVGKQFVVKHEKYKAKGNNSQIFILFRAGEFREDVKPAGDEDPLIHDELPKNSPWNLSVDKNRQVIDLDNASKPVHKKMTQISESNAAGTQTNPELQSLGEEVKQLREEVKQLREDVKQLKLWRKEVEQLGNKVNARPEKIK